MAVAVDGVDAGVVTPADGELGVVADDEDEPESPPQPTATRSTRLISEARIPAILYEAWHHARMRTKRLRLPLVVLVAAAASVLLAGPAAAHERATARLDAPAAGAVVGGDAVEVVISAFGPGTPAEFQLFLDDAPVDSTGEVGGVFTTLRVAAGAELRLIVALATEGEHELRLVPAPHEVEEPPITRRFSNEVVVKSTESPAAAAPPASDPARRPLERGTILVILLGVGLLGSGIGAAVYAATHD